MINLLTKFHLDVLNKVRKIKDRVFKPLIDPLPDWLKPFHFTSLRIIILTVGLILYILDIIGWVTFVTIIILAALTDWLDGALARAKQSGTEFGVTYDLLADRLMFLAIFLFFYQLDQNTGWLAQGLIDLITGVAVLIAYLIKKRGSIRKIMTVRWLVFLIWLVYYFISLVLK